jgi:two-component system cell cycle sensor histidine kinase/response regulator CckA
MIHIIPKDDPKQALRIKRFLMAFDMYIIWMLIILSSYYEGMFARSPVPINWIVNLVITINLIIFFLIRSGLNRRFKDPSLTMIQMVIGTIFAMFMAYCLDDGREIMLLLYILVFAFGTFNFKMKFRQYCLISVFALLAYGFVITLLIVYHPKSVNLKVELLNLCTLFSVLIWFSFIGSHMNEMRKKLINANDELSNANSELNNANALIKLREERYRTIFENTGTANVIISEDSIIQLANSNFERLTGHSKQELEGKMSWTHFVAEDDLDKMKQYHTMRRHPEESVPGSYEFRSTDRNGNVRDLFMNVALIPGTKESIASIIDITERKNLEEHLARAQKMEAIGTLAGGIAHDFNNLLMGILGNISLIRMKFDNSHPFFDRLKNVEEYVKRGSDLTKQLLGFARGGKYEVKPTDLGDFIRKNSEMFGRTKKEILIHYNIHDNLLPVEVDRGQMEQVLINMYVNAWQAMPGGGDLYLSVENVSLDKMDVSPYNIKPGEFVKVTITDTGIGMDEPTKAHIFEPFFTTKERGHGTGLGLASAYGIIKNHGGFIHVESGIKQGTSFMIYLPASDREIEDEYSMDDRVQEGNETVLLIDDEEMILDVGSKMLEGLGYNVMTAAGGKQGLEMYEQNRDTIALVILDMIMPDLSGGDTFEELRRIDPTVRVLLSSGYSIEGQAKDIMQNGCNSFIQKPFSMAELSRKIRRILNWKDPASDTLPPVNSEVRSLG